MVRKTSYLLGKLLGCEHSRKGYVNNVSVSTQLINSRDTIGINGQKSYGSVALELVLGSQLGDGGSFSHASGSYETYNLWFSGQAWLERARSGN
jgi:hypothetical protein